MLEKVRTDDVEVCATHDLVEVAIINRILLFRSSEMTFSWQPLGSALVTKVLMQHVVCKSTSATIAGIEIDNGHHTADLEKTDNQRALVKYAVWAHLTCFDSARGTFAAEIKNIQTQMTNDLYFTAIEVSDL